MLKRRFLFEWLVVLAISLCGFALFTTSNLGDRLDNLLLDNALSWRADPPSDEIILVAIDEQSLSQFGQMPWPRNLHADIIARLTESRPRAIGYDVLFTEPSDAGADATLAAAIKASGVVTLPAYIQQPGSNGRASDVIPPIPPMRNAAKAVGQVNVRFDGDGLVRRVSTFFESAAGLPNMMKALHDGLPKGKSGEQQPAEFLIPYNSAGSFRLVSAAAVLNREVPPEFFADKLVLVGATAPGLGDTLPVPAQAGSVMPGVEVQANVLNALLDGRFTRPAPDMIRLAVGVVGLALLFLAYLKCSPTMCLIITIGAGLFALVGSALLLKFGQYWFPPGALLFGLLLAYPLWSWRRLATLNSFIEHETRSLGASLSLKEGARSQRTGLDAVADAAAGLKAVMGELVGIKSFMQRVIDNAPDALAVVDKDGLVTLTNPAAANLLGAKKEAAPLSRQLERIAPINPRTNEMNLPDGRVMLVKSSSFAGDNAEEHGAIIRLADITERRNAERQREEALEFLSHDMRAPQSSIIGLIDMAAADRHAELPVGRIRALAETSLKLADDFVQLARLETTEPEMEDVELCSLLTETIDRHFAKARAKSIRIEQQSSEEVAFVTGDGWLLSRAIANLIDNAIKYSPEGSQVSCVISNVVEPLGFSLTIQDQGVGISADRQKDLFQRFGARDHSAGLSSGLGLAFVKKIVDLHGGTIACQSDGGGTAFTIQLPAAAE